MNVLDLFSGIGGFSLGLERAGMRTVAFCEIEPYCREVLAQHWPDVHVFGDIRALTVDEGWLVSNADERCEPAEKQLRTGRQGIRADGIDVICGGFPCQDISSAGKGIGITGERSGLWKEYARLIGEVRPRYVIVENVAALLSRGLDVVLGDLSALGYDAEWHCIPASAVGAPHRRDRLWLVAYPSWIQPGRQEQRSQRERVGASSQSVTLADAECIGRHQVVASAFGRAFREAAASEVADSGITAGRGWWLSEPAVGRVANGVPDRVDRLKALGNSVVPQIPEIIGRAIMTVSDMTKDRT